VLVQFDSHEVQAELRGRDRAVPETEEGVEHRPRALDPVQAKALFRDLRWK
jgi:hypothetical protein